MRLNLNKLYIVYTPTRLSEKVDVFDDRPTTIKSLINQARGGLTPAGIHAVFTTKPEAVKEAGKLFRKHKIKR
ncbi:MAG: hypothetical protein H6585_10030 [Flavobacteriales bacterium]|nr:hypothetical protein [Flavobacteriales bacterium]